MCRLRFIEPENYSATTKEIFERQVFSPNLLSLIANSEGALKAFMSMYADLKKGKLNERFRKVVSLAVSEFNECGYCIALHTFNAVSSRTLDEQECLDARRFESADPKTGTLLNFTKQVLAKKGRIQDPLIESVKHQGFDDEEIVEILALISLITMANYIANVGKPDMDFPESPDLNTSPK